MQGILPWNYNPQATSVFLHMQLFGHSAFPVNRKTLRQGDSYLFIVGVYRPSLLTVECVKSALLRTFWDWMCGAYL